MVTLNVNGIRHEVQAPDDTPLLYVLRARQS
jgi:aerobic-type carbon monoxide dehydrogenase small subunit (CoxS/CutS family)